ncbi:hypothetical protein GE09DRAFT_1077256 [Coniochaeta sp. 2T2.1]|nr:hypothetical protein GE09DRAFT_1077256 [Coniochaeta sp. 2T2.1]
MAKHVTSQPITTIPRRHIARHNTHTGQLTLPSSASQQQLRSPRSIMWRHSHSLSETPNNGGRVRNPPTDGLEIDIGQDVGGEELGGEEHHGGSERLSYQFAEKAVSGDSLEPDSDVELIGVRITRSCHNDGDFVGCLARPYHVVAHPGLAAVGDAPLLQPHRIVGVQVTSSPDHFAAFSKGLLQEPVGGDGRLPQPFPVGSASASYSTSWQSLRSGLLNPVLWCCIPRHTQASPMP